MFYENRSDIKKIVISFVYLFCPKTSTKFRDPYHSNHVIPHREYFFLSADFSMGINFCDFLFAFLMDVDFLKWSPLPEERIHFF